jgi:TatD DNase family protein
VGIHPNDCSENWQKDMREIAALAKRKEEYKIVAIGECGIDKHYPEYNLQRQKDAFKAQIELALEHDLAIIVHTRDAGDETLRALDDFRGEALRGTIHCFSEDLAFAQHAIGLGFVLGIGGTVTYQKNNYLRSELTTVDLEHIILETDAPFLPPQTMRGKPNHPKYIETIARYVAELRSEPFELIAEQTTKNVQRIFRLA